jgi:hypothetical protein
MRPEGRGFGSAPLSYPEGRVNPLPRVVRFG